MLNFKARRHAHVQMPIMSNRIIIIQSYFVSLHEKIMFLFTTLRHNFITTTNKTGSLNIFS